MTPEQRRKNRNTALGLLIVVIAIVAWFVWRTGTSGG
jgi:hypothetical protein